MGHINNAYKRDPNMTYESKYKNLGKNERIRIPKSCVEHTRSMIEKFDILCLLAGEDRVFKLMGILEKCLDNEIEKARQETP